MRSQTRVLRWGRIDDEAMDYCILYMDCHRRIGGVDRSQCKLRAALRAACCVLCFAFASLLFL